ncbi:hypothetical protein bsdtw1_04640 [Clostridium fungisolvens]|uniref:Uncharacterized protein n=1 Tax=Clostridium fungisolvens TaxID=1604897 RepID=A0A6V8SML9_9CLOT|nr:hypothetical protein bsdtw1_04640 [Clostridium fungisolvens]
MIFLFFIFTDNYMEVIVILYQIFYNVIDISINVIVFVTNSILNPF